MNTILKSQIEKIIFNTDLKFDIRNNNEESVVPINESFLSFTVGSGTERKHVDVYGNEEDLNNILFMFKEIKLAANFIMHPIYINNNDFDDTPVDGVIGIPSDNKLLNYLMVKEHRETTNKSHIRINNFCTITHDDEILDYPRVNMHMVSNYFNPRELASFKEEIIRAKQQY